jgi:hypothetical protein
MAYQRHERTMPMSRTHVARRLRYMTASVIFSAALGTAVLGVAVAAEIPGTTTRSASDSSNATATSTTSKSSTNTESGSSSKNTTHKTNAATATAPTPTSSPAVTTSGAS